MINTKQNKQAFLVLSALITFVISLLLMVHTANAEVTNVLDNANVMSRHDVNIINEINNDDLSRVKGHPQIAVITENNVDDIEDYAQNQFDKYHFGRKGLDNGILVVISIENHKIRIQTGYGVEDATPDAWAGSDAVDGEPKRLFRDEKYGAGICVIVRRIANRLAAQEGSIKSKDQIIADEKQKAEAEAEFNREVAMMMNVTKWIALLAAVLMLGGFVAYAVHQKKEEQRERKFMADILATPLAKKHHFTGNPYEGSARHAGDMIYLAQEMINQSPYMDDLKLCASILILNDSFESLANSTSGQVKIGDLSDLHAILEKTSLDDALEHIGYLRTHWGEFDQQFDQDCTDTMSDVFNEILDDPHPIYDLSNKKRLKTAFNSIVRDTNKDFNWYPILQECVTHYIETGETVHVRNVMTANNYSALTGTFSQAIIDKNLDYTLEKVDGQRDLVKAMNETNYSERTAYNHLTKKKKAQFIDAVDDGDMALAASFLVGAMLAMQEERIREEERRRREEQEEELRRMRDNDDDNDHFFGGGDFGGGDFGGGGSFGGFGGSSGGGGATSSW